ncbi:MAG: glucose/arabinose dehydrogenase [Janthinobacterium sp.]|jgi:glucose/arabinose dehydrogenase
MHLLKHSRVLRALVAAFGLTGACCALAQQVAAPAVPAIPPTWAQGRTAEQANSNLVPHPPGLTALAVEDIPTASLKVPPGFKVELWAAGMPNARSMVQSPSGVLYVGTRFPGNVYAVIDKGGRREVKVIAKGLHRPNGVAFKDGALYVAELSKITRYDNIEADLDHPPVPVVVFDALPKDEPHGWKFLRLSPDGKYLYFQIGTPANITMQPVTHATINRLNLQTNVMDTVVHGVRNSVGMDFHPVTKELWFTNNGRDWVNDDLPNDTLHRVTKKGMNFGFPFCHQGDLLDPDFGRGRSCDEFDKPAMKIGPHVAALGMRFYTGKQFPKEYKNNIFIAEHGSWNRTKKTGYDVIRVVLDAKGNPIRQEPFITGWAAGEEFWGRPADVHVMPDGALLVSDDVAGAIFRVSHAK